MYSELKGDVSQSKLNPRRLAIFWPVRCSWLGTCERLLHRGAEFERRPFTARLVDDRLPPLPGPLGETVKMRASHSPGS